MRILFVTPHYPYDISRLLLHPNLAFGYLSNALKAESHEILVADLPITGNDPSNLASVICEYLPDLIGITCVSQSYPQALDCAQICKLSDPSIPIVMGGPHTTFIAEEVIRRHKQIDYVLVFDSEVSIVKLVRALQSKSMTQLFEVPGLAFRHHDQVIVTMPQPPSRTLDSYGIPDRSIFDMDWYLHHDYETTAITSRGCPSKCTFCSTTANGRAFRWNTANHVCNELEEIAALGFKSVFFGDDTFSANVPRTLEFCDEMKRRRINIEWTSNMRALDARDNVLQAMKSAGAYRVFMGFESIQHSNLQLFKKGSLPKQAIESAKRVKKAGLELHAAFIVGAPDDTHESLRATAEFIRILDPAVATFNAMEPRPGTEVYLCPEKYNIIIPDKYWYEKSNWVDKPVCYTNNLTAEEIRNWIIRLFDEFCTSKPVPTPAIVSI